ncbi:MAG: isoprenylcysteine carboxylmethyltransferase family protein [Candidatus Lokiarchaeia archaeon]|jgi:protein-S-isoprenylcysteine O-methyltransferase Ste14
MVTSVQNLQRRLYTMQSPMNVVGALIFFIVGLVISVNAQMTLKRNYSGTLRIREGHQLITHGIYKYVRHPVYTGTLLRAFAITIFAMSPLGFLFALTGIPLFMYRIGVEEKMLIEEFGDEYLEYSKVTWKLIPYVYCARAVA